MVLVIDVGNTNTVLGVYELAENGAEKKSMSRLLAHWRITTIKTQTVDEYGVLFRNLFSFGKIEAADVSGIIVSSVVPPIDSTLREVCERYFQVKPMFVEPGIKTGMPVHYENPQEVCADRIVNGVAAFEKYRRPSVAAAFGTPPTFYLLPPQGQNLGRAISPRLLTPPHPPSPK